MEFSPRGVSRQTPRKDGLFRVRQTEHNFHYPEVLMALIIIRGPWRLLTFIMDFLPRLTVPENGFPRVSSAISPSPPFPLRWEYHIFRRRLIRRSFINPAGFSEARLFSFSFYNPTVTQ